MCTLSIIPGKKEELIFTFNRDESPLRASTLPQLFENGICHYYAPVDLESGGTWLAFTENGDVVFLMNGAFTKHNRAKSYRHSRGLIIPRLLESFDSITFLNELNLNNIEPFTLLYYRNKSLIHYTWDGFLLHTNELNSKDFHLFSSSTLYNSETKNLRRKWLSDFIEKNTPIQADKLFQLHTNSIQNQGFKYNGTAPVQTVSTTQFILDNTAGSFIHTNHIDNTNWSTNILWKKTMPW